jgi:hypothetical protein
MARLFGASGKEHAVRIEDHLHKHASHAAATPDNANFHAVTHRQTSGTDAA